MTNAVGAAIEKRKALHPVERHKEDFATVLPTHVNADQWTRLVRGQFRTNPALERILQTNPGSVLHALMDCAQKGLVLGDTYHLLPFGNEVTGTPDYTGLIELMYRAGEVAAVHVEIVYEGDHFRYWPDQMDKPEHRPDWFGGGSSRSERKMIGVYAYATMHDGSTSQVVIMDEAAVHKVRAVSKTWQKSNSMWKLWPDRAWKKTAIRQLAKFVPTSTEYRTAKIRDVQAAQQPVPSTAAMTALGGAIPPALHDDDIQDAELVEPDVPGDAPAAIPPAQEQAPVDAEVVPPADGDAPTVPSPELISKSAATILSKHFATIGINSPEGRVKAVKDFIGRDIAGMAELTVDQANAVTQAISKLALSKNRVAQEPEDVPLPDEPQ